MWEWNDAANWIHANWLWVLLVYCAGEVLGYHRGYGRGWNAGETEAARRRLAAELAKHESGAPN